MLAAAVTTTGPELVVLVVDGWLTVKVLLGQTVVVRSTVTRGTATELVVVIWLSETDAEAETETEAEAEAEAVCDAVSGASEVRVPVML